MAVVTGQTKMSLNGVAPAAQGALITTVTFTNFTVAAGSNALNDVITTLRNAGISASA